MAETAFVTTDDAQRLTANRVADLISMSDTTSLFFRLDGYMELHHFRRGPDRAAASPAARRWKPTVTN